MREDMNKVLVERPRTGGKYPKRTKPNTKLADLPKRESMSGRRKYGYRAKELNENLQPLWRFLDTKVGKSWNKTFSEIKKVMDDRSATQKHIFEHLEFAVGDPTDSVYWRQPMYIVVRGLLQKNPNYGRKRIKVERRRLDLHRVLLKQGGVWYLCKLKRLPTEKRVITQTAWVNDGLKLNREGPDTWVDKNYKLKSIDTDVYAGVNDVWLREVVSHRMDYRTGKPLGDHKCRDAYGLGNLYCAEYREATSDEVKRSR